MSSNARWLIASKAATKLGDILCSAKTTVPWLVLSVGAPAHLVGLLVPIRESGSMLPQVFIAPWVQGIEPRRRAAIGALVAQAASILVLVLLATTLSGLAAGLGICLGLALLSAARAVASVSSKDLLGRSVPKGERGAVNGRATSLAGLIGLAGAAATLWVARPESIPRLAIIVGAAALGFGLGAALLLRVRESPKEATVHPRMRIAEALRQPRLRRFVVVRTLLAGSALGGPFLVVLGRHDAASLRTLSAFVLAAGAASFLSAGSWGRLADASGRACMALGGAVAAFAAGSALALPADLPGWAMPTVYFAFAVGYEGVRVGRKTYVVDLAEGGERTQFVATSNTAVAVALLVFGSILAAMPNASTALGAAAVLTLTGALGCAALPKT